MKKIKITPLFALALIFSLLSLSACRTTKTTHGQIISERQLAALKPNVHQQPDVRAILGSPSTTSTLNGNKWYYITAGSVMRPIAGNQVTGQEVLIANFNEAGTLTHLSTRTSDEHGRAIIPKEGETPTQGEKLGILEQLIQNLGLGL